MNTVSRTDIEQLAAKMRSNPTSAERIFLNSMAYYYFGKGMRFEHIVQINEEFFILDFYIELDALKIAVEVDGNTHYKQGEQENDKRRDKLLAENLGIITYRIPARHLYEGMVDRQYMFNLFTHN
jgi:very-short-patch-repair endonuclease